RTVRRRRQVRGASELAALRFRCVTADAGASTKTVLVVDDDRPLRTLCRTALEEADFRVLEAADGQQALASVHDEQPDLILLDIMMPGISGWEVTSTLLADPATDRIPIILMTAGSELAERVPPLGRGAQH